MGVIGIIAEYNPFHNGHLYLLKRSKEATRANYVIAIMSGNFLQRGEPAFWNKWERTKMALSAGIDLVIELPFVFASQDAGSFALAGVKILESLGIVDYITFGCENDNIELFSRLAKLINNNSYLLKNIERKELKKGGSFPKIREKMIISLFKNHYQNSTKSTLNEVKSILRNPNNILALEYIISLQRLNSSIKAIPVKRIGSDFNQDTLGGEYSSATAVRKTINQYYCDPQNIKLLEEIKKTMPISSYNIVLDQLNKSINPVLYSNFEQMIFCKLRSLLVNDLKNINGIEEGLENKIKKAILFSTDIEGLITAIKSKRYTRTRIQRIIIHSLFSLTKKEVKNFNNDGPLYCRILGMSDKGRILLRKAKTVSCLPIVQKLKYFYQHNKKYNNTSILKMIDYDILATDLYVLAYNQKYLKTGSQDFTNKVEMYKI